jgi:exodeoxyribonuclease VII large subunit
MEIAADEPILSVTELNREARLLLEDALPSVWVEGEISNYLRHGSGHMYFGLKDQDAQVRCAMFRGANRSLSFQPANGQQVLVNARVTVYEARGSYQLVVQHMEPAGEGLLRRQFEELRARLSAEGLFAEAHKQALPGLPRRIGVVTSASGAAVRDILKVLGQRFPAVPVLIFPVQVQGERASIEIAAALEMAGRRGDCDLLIVGRGGGSLEDLWAFNEERVVRAIHACPIPIISAVGHESDVTLADFVADLRAATPSAAAEQAVPDRREWLRVLNQQQQRLSTALQRRLERQAVSLASLSGRLSRVHPAAILQQHAQRLDELLLRARRASLALLARAQTRLAHADKRLQQAAPLTRIDGLRQQLLRHDTALLAAVQARLEANRQRAALLAAELQAVSPLATLERGYALVTNAQGELVRDASALQPGELLDTRLARGSFSAEVKKTSED